MPSSIIARIIDAEASDEGGMAHMASRVSNQADADRILRAWANKLVDQLDRANEVAGG